MKFIEWQNLGSIPYREGWSLQNELREKRVAGDIVDRILLLEHPPVITLGKRDCQVDIVSSIDAVESDGIEIVKTDRGGRATYHGPGQLICYFICSLGEMGMGIRHFVRAVEDICIGVLSDFEVTATRDPINPGLWIGNDKIVAIGLSVSRGVTMHGIAVNLGCDLSAYRHIVACGIQDRGVTSMERVLGEMPDMRLVSDSFIARTGTVLNRDMIKIDI